MARVAALVVGELRNMHELVWRRHFIRTLHKLSAAWSAVYVSTWADQIGCLPGGRATHAPTSWRILEVVGSFQLPIACLLKRRYANCSVRVRV